MRRALRRAAQCKAKAKHIRFWHSLRSNQHRQPSLQRRLQTEAFAQAVLPPRLAQPVLRQSRATSSASATSLAMMIRSRSRTFAKLAKRQRSEPSAKRKRKRLLNHKALNRALLRLLRHPTVRAAAIRARASSQKSLPSAKTALKLQVVEMSTSDRCCSTASAVAVSTQRMQWLKNGKVISQEARCQSLELATRAISLCFVQSR